jgi:bisphosphoglycerate-independent phosphoglycerate mutase (AlkP superfamily)
MADLLTGEPSKRATNSESFHLIDEHVAGLKLCRGGALENVAPTIPSILGIEKTVEMTSRDLREI